MLMTLLLVNGLDAQIVDAGELDYESDRFLIQTNCDLQQVFQEMEKNYKIRSQTINITEDVTTDIKKVGPHQVGFTAEFNTVEQYYREYLIDLLISSYGEYNCVSEIAQFDFG
jgi:hypothetical protein